jgi:hypothetical protein
LSDNAKTFKAAAKEVSKITRAKEVKRYMADEGVEWEFIIEKAPWQGGFWERLVKSVKRCLKKVVGRAFLTFEELRTVLVEIEGTLNNRPLTFVYDDERGMSYPLTPSSLLYGRSIATTGNDGHYEIVSTNQSLTRREKHHRMLLKHFTTQWRSEYLTSLLESARATSGAKNVVAVGDIVLLKSDKTSRAFWKVAKVEHLISGQDGVIRSAKVSVISEGKTWSLRRPIQHLVPLKLSSSSQRDEREEEDQTTGNESNELAPDENSKPRRKAAVTCDVLRRNILKYC